MNRVTRIRARFLRAIASIAAGVAIATPASASLFSNVYVFGDSLLDVGNVYTVSGGTLPPSPPYFNGRWSNGPLAVDIFAAAYGVTLGPSVLGGTNFAWGGARAPSTPGGVPDTIDQVQAFVAGLGVNPADKNAVYVLDGGGNDIKPALETGTQAGAAAVIGAAVVAMQQSIAALVGKGAQNVLVYNLPDVGKTPEIAPLGPQVAGFATALSVAFNQGLAQVVQGFNQQGFNVDIVDLFGLNLAAIANPAAFGFTNVTDACFNGVTVCANPDQYFYWDTFHPTAHTGRLLAGAMFAAVPEPGSVMLIAIALVGFAFARRRAR